jgi:hypothetical protein
MKITRRQLRQIIKEELGTLAVMTRMRGQNNRKGYTSGLGLYEDDDQKPAYPDALPTDVDAPDAQSDREAEVVAANQDYQDAPEGPRKNKAATDLAMQVKARDNAAIKGMG